MRRLMRIILSGLLGILLVLDAIVVVRLSTSGWPKYIIVNAADHAAQVQAIPMHLNTSGWLLVVAYGCVHALLCYGVWRVWRSRGAVHL